MRLRIEHYNPGTPKPDGKGVWQRPCTRVTDLDTGLELANKLLAVDIHIGLDDTYAKLTFVPEEIYVDGVDLNESP